MDYKIFDYLEEGIVIYDNQYIIQYCNKSVLKHLQYSYAEIEKEHLAKLTFTEIETIIQVDKFGTEEIIEIYLCDRENRKIKSKCKLIQLEWEGKNAFGIVINEYIRKAYTIEDLENVIEHMPYAVWITDAEGRYIYIAIII